MKRILLFLFVGCLAQTAQAQFQYGFKTGVNFSRFNGPSEIDANGMELESFENITGFHIGATFTYRFTDAFNVQGELLFSKQGTKYTYEGQGYRYFRDEAQNTALAKGNLSYKLNVNNAYVTIPVLAQGRWRDLEISGGFYAGLLLTSNGDGAMTFSGKTDPLNNTVYAIYEGSTAQVEEIEYFLDHNYRKDGIGEAAGDEFFKVRADNKLIEQYRYIGAYYDFTEDRGNIYNNFDYGLMGGLTWYISSSLYLGGRFEYGLADVTNNDADMARAEVGENGEVLYRDDKDHNVMIQVSVGFKF